MNKGEQNIPHSMLAFHWENTKSQQRSYWYYDNSSVIAFGIFQIFGSCKFEGKCSKQYMSDFSQFCIVASTRILFINEGSIANIIF